MFASDFPTATCPLDGAEPCNSKVYLLCKEISDDDPGFKTAKQRGVYKDKTDENEICKTHGLSVFSTFSSCESMFKKIPQGRRIAVGELTPPKGVICETKASVSNHHTWWPYEGITRSDGFDFA